MGPSRKKSSIPGGATPGAVLRQRLLNRVADFYHKSFQENPQPQAALKALGLTDLSLFADFKTGHSAGALHSIIPSQSEMEESLKGAGILTDDGKELFDGCVTFPWFNENSDCVGMWGLRVSDGEGLYLPGPRVGVWNWQAMKRSRHVLLTSSILDALFFYQAGWRDVVPLWGEQGLTDDHKRAFQRYGVKEVVLTYEAGPRVVQALKEEEVRVKAVKLPMGVSDFFRKTPEAAKAFETYLAAESPDTPLESEALRKARESGYEPTATGFMVEYGERRYEIKSVQKEGVKLKVTVKAMKPGEKRSCLDSIDLYSRRSRVLFAKDCGIYFGEKPEVIEDDFGKLMELAEGFTPKGAEAKATPGMTKEQEAEALAFLRDPDLLDQILFDFERCGYTGEEANKLMGYLAAVSRKLPDPLSVVVQSRSAAGKSSLQEAILRFVPEEDYEKYTRLTGQALFYKDEGGLAHKILAIEEEAGAREAGYSIRNLQSSKYLSIATTEKDPVTGKLRTVEYRVKGPVALMLTTTAIDMDYETQNRFVTLTIDESKEMTERILAHQRELETVAGLRKRREGDSVTAKHQNAQRLLRPLAVVNPYAPKLTFPANTLRARRDHKKYLGVIKAMAFLHQYQREVKTVEVEGPGGALETVSYIEATLSDIEKANRLCGEVLGQTLNDLSAPGRALLNEIRGMVKAKAKEAGVSPGEYRFTRRDIREAAGWSDFQVKTHIGELEDLEYLYSVTGQKGKEYVYELVSPEGGEDGKPFLAGLMKVEALG